MVNAGGAGDPSDDMKNDTAVTEATAVFDVYELHSAPEKRFVQRTDFIGHAYQHGLFAFRERERRQRPHMAFDDVLFVIGDPEIPGRVSGGCGRMRETMPWFVMVMPVI